MVILKNYEVLCLAFKRPYHYNEYGHSTAEEKFVPWIDWENSLIFPRYHGIYIGIYFYNNFWHTTSYISDSIYAREYCKRKKISPNQLFQLMEPQYELPQKKNIYYGFVFHPEFEFLYCYSGRSAEDLENIPISELTLINPSWDYIEQIYIRKELCSTIIEGFQQNHIFSPLLYSGLEVRCHDNIFIFHSDSFKYLLKLAETQEEESLDYKGISTMEMVIHIYLSTPENQISNLITFFPNISSIFDSICQYLRSIFGEINKKFDEVQALAQDKRQFSKIIQNEIPEIKSILFSMKNLHVETSEELFRLPQILNNQKTMRILIRLTKNKISVKMKNKYLS